MNEDTPPSHDNVRLGCTRKERFKGWLIYIKSIYEMMRK